jgi:hypothetical protein
MTSHSTDSDQVILSDLRTLLQRQWEEHQYAVTVEQAHAVLGLLNTDSRLLADCARLKKFNLASMVWDIATADSKRKRLRALISERRQAQNTVTTARRRAPSVQKLDEPSLTQQEFERYVRAKHHPGQNAVEQLTGAVTRFSTAPGAERKQRPSIRKGRRAEIVDWLIGRVNESLCAVPNLKYEKRIELLGRILTSSGFLQPKTEGADCYEAAQKKLFRMNTRRIPRPSDSR